MSMLLCVWVFFLNLYLCTKCMVPLEARSGTGIRQL